MLLKLHIQISLGGNSEESNISLEREIEIFSASPLLVGACCSPLTLFSDLSKEISAPEQVYLIRESSGVYKIGTTNNTARRLKQLQTGNSRQLTCLATCPGGKAVEDEFHQKFKFNRSRGEFFSFDKETLRLVVWEFYWRRQSYLTEEEKEKKETDGKNEIELDPRREILKNTEISNPGEIESLSAGNLDDLKAGDFDFLKTTTFGVPKAVPFDYLSSDDLDFLMASNPDVSKSAGRKSSLLADFDFLSAGDFNLPTPGSFDVEQSSLKINNEENLLKLLENSEPERINIKVEDKMGEKERKVFLTPKNAGFPNPKFSASDEENKYIISECEKNFVKVWQLDLKDISSYSKVSVKYLHGHKKEVTAVVLSKDQQRVFSASEDRTIKMWHVSTGKCVKTFSGHIGCVNSLALDETGCFSPPNQRGEKANFVDEEKEDYMYVFSGSRDKTIKMWDVSTGENIKTFTGHEGWVTTVVISADRRYIFSGSRDKTIKMWNISTGQIVKSFSGHKRSVKSLFVTEDRLKIISASDDQTVKIWDITSGQVVNTFSDLRNSFQSLVLTEDPKLLFLARFEKIEVWDIFTGKIVKTLAKHKGLITSFVTTKEQRHVISASDDKRIRVWDVVTGKLVKTFSGHSGNVNTILLTEDQQYIIISDEDYNIRIWHIATGRLVKSFTTRKLSDVKKTIHTEDFKHTFEIGWGWSVEMWQFTPQRELIKTFPGHTNVVTSLAITKDQQYLFSASEDKTVKMWDISKGKLVKTFTGHEDSVSLVFVAEDQQHIFSISKTTVKMWQIASSECVKTFLASEDFIKSAAVIQDLQVIFSDEGELTVKKWHVAGKENVKRYTVHEVELND